MHRAKRLPVLVVAVALVATGCSRGPSDEIIDALLPAVRGQGVPAAREYADGSVPHRVVVVGLDGRRHDWTGDVPRDWWPSSIEETELIAVVGDEREVQLERVEYYNGPPITRYGYEVQVRLVAAATGDLLDLRWFSGEPPRRCEETEDYYLARLTGEHVTFEAIEGWLRSYVMSDVARLPNRQRAEPR